jgi:hypothetical protein
MQESPKDSRFLLSAMPAAVADPLACGDCSAIICRQCGTPLERVDDLGIG